MNTPFSAQNAGDNVNLLDAVMTCAPLGIGIFNRELRCIDLNPALAELIGTPRELTIGRTIREVVPDLADGIEPFLLQVLVSGQPILNQEIAGETVALPGTHQQWQVTCHPLCSGCAEIIGVVVFVEEITGRKLQELLFANEIAERTRIERLLEERLQHTETIRHRLEVENLSLESEVRKLAGQDKIIGASAALMALLDQAARVARTGTTVLIQGETGTGKELLAQFIHQNSVRSQHLLVRVNCAAIPVTLLEGELFGWEKGAYTHAVTSQAGLFEIADGSTIVLDEIGELPLDAQVKLLRVLQDGQYFRLGSNQARMTDVRVIASTNRDLAQEVRLGRFREDLYYRLNVFLLTVPPLRERTGDIPLLVRFFIEELGARLNSKTTVVKNQDMAALKKYPWPGNIRELRNVIENALILSRGDTLTIRLPESIPSEPEPPLTLQELEYRHIVSVLHTTSWKVHGPRGAAHILGIHPSTLFSRMKKLGIPRQSQKNSP